ncbi:Gas vesicle synthesis protein GvpL/GvpF [Pseudonocardia thermophila]|uniref:Gas vesicle synthesis protein GvpL/GvpF n=1 Tax=Pseudonocardia thermophila TaxID=1848 RepID=A0A1M6XY81_PSETH|nr:GvpL/GvpF family gas vesicle protein [Pseudonocardia thermophila]SHL10775.1 Gas vesicle synthesis protein GvpL/GvpF [Pseudonocardia thermophila]
MLTYLYAIGRVPLEPPDRPGVDAEPPRVIVEDGFAAVVGSVAPARFDEAALAHDLEDLRRVEELARAHHRLVAALPGDGPVAPVRLATIYRDDDGVRRLLRERATELGALLDRLGTCREWGVKMWSPPRPAADAQPVPADAERPGTSYLMRRRAARDADAHRRAQGTELAEHVHRTLSRLAVAARRLAPQDAVLSGRTEEMLLNTTYLVRREDEAAFTAAVAGAGASGAEIVRTGPWPPFSFATVDDP